MNMNLIDFPPWRKSGGALEDIPLLAQDLVLAAQPLQLGRDVLLGLDRWIIQALLAVAIHPGPQGGQSDPEILRNLPPRAPARLGKAHGLVSELWCKSSRMRHGAPPRSRESSPLSRNKSSAATMMTRCNGGLPIEDVAGMDHDRHEVIMIPEAALSPQIETYQFVRDGYASTGA